MVSTRGTKCKFNKGEKVLCYETDPNKTRLLFESKIIDLLFNKGGKVEKYFIHFIGWKSSYDRHVTEDKILPYTEENIKLQKALQEEAALYTANKKRKSSHLPKGKLNKKHASDNKVPKKGYSSESESNDEYEGDEKELKVDLPESLKKILEEDYYQICKQGQLLSLPPLTTVVSIIETFVRQYCSSQIPTAVRQVDDPPRLPSRKEQRIRLCREVMDGLRNLFDFALPEILLYENERDQFALLSKEPSTSSVKTNKSKVSKSLRTRSESKKSTKEPTTSDSKPSETKPSTHLASQVATWRLVSPETPSHTLPSLLYGAVHLMRLISKLSDIVKKMNMRPSKITILYYFIIRLVKFMEEEKDNFFNSSFYRNKQSDLFLSNDK